MENTLTAFQIDARDNVATALSEIPAGAVVQIHGTGAPILVTAAENILVGHKIALRDIADGQNIVKYGVVIGRSTANIPKGACDAKRLRREIQPPGCTYRRTEGHEV